MGMIEKDSWNIIEKIIRRYPQMKAQYQEYMDEIMTSSGSSNGIVPEESNVPQSVTEAKALKMNSRYMDRIRLQIEAIEYTYKNLSPEEQKVVRIRYWQNRWKSTPYLKMKAVSYSERQMKRIVYKVIKSVGQQIGEIK